MKRSMLILKQSRFYSKQSARSVGVGIKMHIVLWCALALCAAVLAVILSEILL